MHQQPLTSQRQALSSRCPAVALLRGACLRLLSNKSYAASAANSWSFPGETRSVPCRESGISPARVPRHYGPALNPSPAGFNHRPRRTLTRRAVCRVTV
eukprot:1180664-Prorocentrum_minimum.AAC.5